MSRSLQLEVESSADVHEVFSAFADAAYWQARLATFSQGTATLDALTVQAGNGVSVTVTVSLLRDRLPGIITQLHQGDVRMVRDEHWRQQDDGRVRGDLNATMPGAPLSMVAQALLTPTPCGSRLDYSASVNVGIPLIGGKIESYITAQAGKDIPAIQRFTDEWIAANR